MFAADSASERATSIYDYQVTCVNFIADISRDYMDWVDKYNLGQAETEARKSAIQYVVKTTSDWIYTYGDTIKKIDIVMNDGVNKMAENTAGYPFSFRILVHDSQRYVLHQTSPELKLRILATPRNERRIRIGKYQKDQMLLLNSSSPVSYNLSAESLNSGDVLDDYIVISTQHCQKGDLISVTAVVEELNEDDAVTESRGLSTLILLT